ETQQRARFDAHAYVRIRLPPSPAPHVDDGPAAAELRLDIDLGVQVLGLHEVVADDVCDRDGVVDRRAVEVVDLFVEVAVELEQVGHHPADAPCEPADVGGREQRFVRHVQSHHRDVDAAGEN